MQLSAPAPATTLHYQPCSTSFLKHTSNANIAVFNLLQQMCRNIETVGQVHAYMIKTELNQHTFYANKILSLYAQCGSMLNAHLLFDEIWHRNAFSWNVMIRGYAANGEFAVALKLYHQMLFEGINPDKFTFPLVLKACAGLSALQEGKEIHGHIIRFGFECDVYVGNALVTMYAKSGVIEVARQVFDKMCERDVVTWTAMIAGYAQNGDTKESLRLFHQMQLANVKPNSVTMATALRACAQLAALLHAKCIHGNIIKNGLESDVVVKTALIDMYAKCGIVEIAGQMFNKMCTRNVVSWTSMIAGYARNGYPEKALMLFHQMQLSDVSTDSATMVNILPACANLAALQCCMHIHCYIIVRGFESDVRVGNTLIDAYAKCGSLRPARQLFDKMSKRDVVSWNAMIAGYGMHGCGEAAIALFKQMQQTCMEPDEITFIGLLSACSYAGLVDEGRRYFNCMRQDYAIPPTLEHYASMADLLGRAGLLDEARDLIETMPIEPDATVWGALLGACRIHGNVELGKRVAECLFELDPGNAGCYILLSNIYAASSQWEDARKVRVMMKERGVKKPTGCSLIEINYMIHKFIAGDRSHPQSENIYATLETLAEQIKEAGYVTQTNFVLHDVEEEVKEHMLCSHSEKLAIAFGIINTGHGTSIRITKNLRVCGDCHSAIKFISKIVRREITVRDGSRFHCFKDGQCSCRDYW